MRLALIIALLLTGACAQMAGGRPESVLLQRDRITVRLSNGWPCTGFREAGQETDSGWSGTLEGCPADYRYDVRLQPGNNPFRMIMVAALGSVGGQDLISPVAEVEITTGTGRSYLFRSPPPTEASDRGDDGRESSPVR